MLEENKIPYYRIDGSLKITERREVLTHFQSSKDTGVLLMTLGTGAVGYVSSPVQRSFRKADIVTYPQTIA